MSSKFLRKATVLPLLFSVAALAFSMPAFGSDEELNEVNRKIHEKNSRWKAGKNELSELPDQERKKRLGIKQESFVAVESPTLSTTGSVSAAPPTVDWRNVSGVSYVTPVKNQGSCGSCWAFAVTAALESQVLMAQRVSMDLSEQILVSCSGAGSCSGGYPSSASAYVQSTGLPTESYFPYTAQDTACANALGGWQNDTQKIWSYNSVANTADALELAVSTYGPVVVAMAVYNDFYYYGSGVYSYTSGSLAGYHAITIVGYDHVNQYFIVKNSWGSGWGEGGYFKIAYSEIGSVVNFGYMAYSYYTSTAAPSIAMVSPNGGEVFNVGTTKTIKWAYQGNPGANVMIQLLKNGSVLEVINPSVAIGSGGVGSYNWSIPANHDTGADYQIMITSNANAAYYSKSAGNFTIAPAPAAPTTPTLKAGLKVTTKGKRNTTTTVQLSWTASSTTVGPISYTIYRNGAYLNKTSNLNYSDSGTVAGGGTYTYTVQATDSLGQKSLMSNSASVSR